MHFISWIWGKSRQRVRILWNDSSKASRTRISLWMKQFRWPMNDQWIIARVDKRLNCQETWVVLSGTGVDRFVVKTLNWGSGLSFPKSFYMWTMCTRDRCTQIKLLNKDFQTSPVAERWWSSQSAFFFKSVKVVPSPLQPFHCFAKMKVTDTILSF